MNELRNIRDITLLGFGWPVLQLVQRVYGPLRVRKSPDCAPTSFVSMSAVMDGIVFHQSAETIETKRAMFDSAKQRILMMDHTKFERRALYHFAHLNEFDAVIVDRGIPVPTLRQIMDMGNVVVADMKGKAGSAEVLRQS